MKETKKGGDMRITDYFSSGAGAGARRVPGPPGGAVEKGQQLDKTC